MKREEYEEKLSRILQLSQFEKVFQIRKIPSTLFSRKRSKSFQFDIILLK
jgi:hypothetical protein